MDRREFVTRGSAPSDEVRWDGVRLATLASAEKGAQNLTTATALLNPGARIPCHRHPHSEVVVVMQGQATILLEGRRYTLTAFDALHIPQGVAHRTMNSTDQPLQLIAVFPTGTVEREYVRMEFPIVDRSTPINGDPEFLRRWQTREAYTLAGGTTFYDLFAGRFGVRGICGGIGIFLSGTSLPCHTHAFDESITIIYGAAECRAAGRRYGLTPFDTACIPAGLPHRFLNAAREADGPEMHMLWVYAGDEPSRTLVDTACCDSA